MKIRNVLSTLSIASISICIASTAYANGVHYLKPTTKNQSAIKVSDSNGNIIITNSCPQTDYMSYVNPTNPQYSGTGVICPPLPMGAACDAQYGASNNAAIYNYEANPYVNLTITNYSTGALLFNQAVPMGQNVDIPCGFDAKQK